MTSAGTSWVQVVSTAAQHDVPAPLWRRLEGLDDRIWHPSVSSGRSRSLRCETSRVTEASRDLPFLVVYDYGSGGLWGVLMAPSKAAIEERYPELDIVNERPRWMSQERYESVMEEPLWLDDEPPQGLLAVLLSDRTRD
jgi:hypothetical protein